MKEIILASASERRSQILTSCGILHRVVPSGADEIMDKDMHIAEIVETNAGKKADLVSGNEPQAIVIGADTLVAHDDDIIGKPDDEKAAKGLLTRFSGGEIEVYTGLCVIDSATGIRVTAVEKSDINVSSLTSEEVERFFRLLAPYDKAGGFSIEGIGSMLFDDIKGSYFNILGLPMIRLKMLFKEAGLNILDYVNL